MRPHKERKSEMHGIKGIGIAVLLMFTMSLAFSAEDLSVLLEKAIYTEETLGKLSDAINLYKEVIRAADADRNIGALALYRLGMCYRKGGKEADAIATFSNLARLYPEQKELIAKSVMLNLKSAPWVDGEVMRLDQKRIGTESASGFGMYASFSVESSQVGRKPGWELRYFIGGSRSPIYYIVTAADAVTLIPFSNRTVSNQTDLETRFASDRIEVVNLKNTDQPPRQILTTGIVYDAWQMVPLLRCLPLSEGFETTVPMFASSSGASANVKFKVAGRENITVPAGSFETYKVVVTSDDNMPTDQIFWISADSHAYLIKAHINGTNDFELKSVEIVGKNQLLNVEDPELGIGLSTPHHWYLSMQAQMSSPSPSGGTYLGGFLTLAAPEFDSSLSVTVSGYRSESLERKTLEIIASAQKYQIRPESRESVAIAGLTGERYIADGRDGTSGEPIVEYAYNLASQAKNYLFRFQTGKDNFDKMKPAFESIMSSLRVR